MRRGVCWPALSFALLACSGDEFSPAASDGGSGGSAGTDAGGSTSGSAGTGAVGSSGTSGGAGAAPVGGNAGAAPVGGSAGTTSSGTGGASGAGLASSGGSGGTAGSGGAGGGPPLPPRVVLVSPTGVDTNDGATPASPTTLAHAIALAQAGGVDARLCVGRYELTQTLQLPAKMSLRGGYDCATFAVQQPLGADAKARCSAEVPATRTEIVGKDATSPVVAITSHAAPPGGATLHNVDVVGTGVGILVAAGSPIIDGCRVAIRGASILNSSSSAGIYVDGGAAQITGTCVLGGIGKAAPNFVELDPPRDPGSTGVTITGDALATVDACAIEGGSGDGNAVSHGSVALLVRNGSPTVKGTTLLGGTGKANRATTVGSAALLVDSWNTGFSPSKSKPKLENNQLDGGSGTQTWAGGTPSVGLALLVRDGLAVEARGPGIELTRAGGNAVRKNVIRGGSGLSSAVLNPSSRGVHGEGGTERRLEVELVENTILGREQKATASNDSAAGVSLDSARGAILQNTIVGGRALTGSALGVHVRNSAGVIIENNMITGGEVLDAGNTIAAIYSEKSTQLTIRHNTLHDGLAAKIFRGRAILVANGTPAETTGMTIDANLLLGAANGTNFVAVQLEGCTLASLASFQNNAMIGYGDHAFRMPNPGTCAPANDVDVVGLATAVGVACGANGEKCGGKLPSVAGSAEVRSTCEKAPAGTCIAVPGCTDLLTCGPLVFQSFALSTKGFGNFVDKSGPELLPSKVLACGLFSNVPPSAPGSVDRFGTPRSPPASRGAFEQAGCQQLTGPPDTVSAGSPAATAPYPSDSDGC